MDFNIVLVIVVGVVILGGLALWLGRGMKIIKDDKGVRLETEAAHSEKSANKTVSVGEGIQLDKTKAGNVTGRETSADDNANVDVEVLKGASINGGQIGDITGEKIERKTNKVE